MSHLSRIKTKFVEKEALLAALNDMQLNYEVGAFDMHAVGGETTQVEIKIKRTLSSDIGLRLAGDSYEVVADWWSVRGVSRAAFMEQLGQRYAYQATRMKLEAQGFNLVEETNQSDGKIRLVLRRMA